MITISIYIYIYLYIYKSIDELLARDGLTILKEVSDEQRKFTGCLLYDNYIYIYLYIYLYISISIYIYTYISIYLYIN